MYKLLLVDDETATREDTKNIDWQEIGIGEVRRKAVSRLSI